MTSWRPTDLRDGRAKRRGRRGPQAVPSGVPRAGCEPAAGCESAAYKRPSVRVPLVIVPMTSAYPCGGRRPWPGALFEMTGVGGLP